MNMVEIHRVAQQVNTCRTTIIFQVRTLQGLRQSGADVRLCKLTKVEEKLLVYIPTVKLMEPRLGKRLPKSLTIDELEILRDSCTSALGHTLAPFLSAAECLVGGGSKTGLRGS